LDSRFDIIPITPQFPQRWILLKTTSPAQSAAIEVRRNAEYSRFLVLI
jgi:hypothetical protein